ncbi:hypothetical protein V3G39_09815 [Dermatophilaceae bacterium Sec6.4]
MGSPRLFLLSGRCAVALQLPYPEHDRRAEGETGRRNREMTLLAQARFYVQCDRGKHCISGEVLHPAGQSGTRGPEGSQGCTDHSRTPPAPWWAVMSGVLHVLHGHVRLCAGEEHRDARSGDLLIIPDARHRLLKLERFAALLTVAELR